VGGYASHPFFVLPDGLFFIIGGPGLNKISTWILKAQIWKETKAQDLIEYALMAGFVAVAAGAIMPGVASKISLIFSKVSSSLTAAGGS